MGDDTAGEIVRFAAMGLLFRVMEECGAMTDEAEEMGVVTRDKSKEWVEEPGAVGVKEMAIMEDGRLGVTEDFVGPVCCWDGDSKKEKSADAQGSAAEDVTGMVVSFPELDVSVSETGTWSDWDMYSAVVVPGVGPRVGVNVDTGELKSGKSPTVAFITDGEETISPQSSSLSSAAAVALIDDIPRSIGVTLKGP